MLRQTGTLLAACFVWCGSLQAQPSPATPEVPPPLPSPVEECVPDDRWSVRGEYLFWWLREGRVPPLLTTSSFASRGVLDQPDTTVLYGDKLETRHHDRFIGTRLTAEGWLDAGHTLGVEARAFFLERDSTYFRATSAGDRLLAIPYVNAQDGRPTSAIVAGPTPDGLRNGGFNGYSR